MTKLKEYKMYINGAWVDAENKKTFKSLNPENNESWAIVPEASENDVGSTPEMSKNLSKIIPRSEFIEIKKGKHLCSIECADDVNITFKKFIDKHND